MGAMYQIQNAGMRYRIQTKSMSLKSIYILIYVSFDSLEICNVFVHILNISKLASFFKLFIHLPCNNYYKYGTKK